MQEPNNGRARGGHGFSAHAAEQLRRRHQLPHPGRSRTATKTRTVEDALATSRFWYTMGEASQAFDENQFDVAAAKYRAALANAPAQPRGAQRAGRPAHQSSSNTPPPPHLRAVDQGSARLARTAGAACSWPTRATTRTRRRWPSRRASRPRSRPRWPGTPSICAPWPASIRPRTAARMLSACWPRHWRCRSPTMAATLKADTKLQYAGILMEAKRYDQAAALYVAVAHRRSRQPFRLDGPGQRASPDGPGHPGHRRRAEDAAGHLRVRARRSRLSLHAGRHLSAGQPV